MAPLLSTTLIKNHRNRGNAAVLSTVTALKLAEYSCFFFRRGNVKQVLLFTVVKFFSGFFKICLNWFACFERMVLALEKF